MKKLLGKIPAMLGMLITLLSLYCYVYSFIDVESEVWILYAILAILSTPFFFIDAIISLVRAIKKDDAKFNYILAALSFGTIPMTVIFADTGRNLFNIIWLVYWLILFVLEVISIKNAIVFIKARKEKVEE